MNNVLFTGGSGLFALNAVFTIRNTCTPILGLHKRQITLPFARNASLDLASSESLEAQLSTLGLTAIVNTIGLADVDLCEREPDRARLVNSLIPQIIAKAAHRLGLPFIHISTDQLFDGSSGLITETRLPSPLNVYGSTKLDAENRILQIHPGSLVIRTNFFCWGTSYRKSFSDKILELLSGNCKVHMPDDVFFSPLLASEAFKFAFKLYEAKAAGLFNVSCGERVSKYQFACALARAFDYDENLIVPIKYSRHPNTALRPHDMSLSNQKAMNFLGIKQPLCINDQISLLVEQSRADWKSTLQSL